MTYKCPECKNTNEFSCTVYANITVDAEGISTESIMSEELFIDGNMSMICNACGYKAETPDSFVS